MKKALSLILVLMICVGAMTTPALAVSIGWDSNAVQTSGDWDYALLNITELKGTAIITKYNGSDRQVTIPASIGGYPVSVIGHSAFERCTSLTAVVIPEGVKRVDDNAFFRCETLASVVLPQSLEYIGSQAFYGTAITSVTIPAGVTEISEWAFNNCQILSSFIVDPNNKTYKSIDGVLYTISPQTLAAYPFGKIEESYMVEPGTTAINAVFSNHYRLKSIGLPASITEIGYGAFREVQRLTDVYFEGTEANWAAISIGDENNTLDTVSMHFNSKPPEPTEQTTVLPNAVRYVPYSVQVDGHVGATYEVTDGFYLPLKFKSDGTIFGTPTELGVFNFTITEHYDGGTVVHRCALTVIYQGATDVEAYNKPGYGFVETETDDGHVQNQDVADVSEVTAQKMHCEGGYEEFRNLYVDAQRLTRDVDYTAEEGSTIITVLEDTFVHFGSGTHTLVAEFERGVSDGTILQRETVYTVQNYTITGIPGTNVNVVVKGQMVLWWDAEPFINSDNRTMTPFRIIADALGLTVGWNDATREAYFTDGSRTIYFPIDGKAARTSEGTTVQMDTAAVIVNGRTYAPVRYLAEYFGYTVAWDGATRTVGIT